MTTSSPILSRGRRIISECQQFLRRSITVEQGLARRSDNFLVLRIVAAAVVIYGHTRVVAPAVGSTDIFLRMGWGIYSGDIAVNIFFLISGFLVTGSYIRQKSLFKFAKARFLRVYGVLFTKLPVVDYLHRPDVWNYISTNLKMSSNMVWHLPGVFEGAKTTTINGSQWTLPAEVRMYVLLGVLGAIGMLVSTRVTTVALGALLLLGAVHPEWFPLHQDWFRLAGYFGLGVFVYMYRALIVLRLELVVALVLAAVLVRHLPVYPAAFALALASAVLWFAYLTPPLRWLERFGDPSYGIYLWGWPSQQAVAYILPGAGLALHASLALVLAVALGYTSWTLFEKQVLRLK